MIKPPEQHVVLNLSVEEENLAAIPFAILERRLGKRISKIEIRGSKVLRDGSAVRVVWQVQGNSELGLPTEQDLDIFVALGVLTFRNNFSKTVTFSGREIAKILRISGVHGKFYQRLKLAMDRFIALRFRALTESVSHQQVKWSNVFQEASFLLDKSSGRCVGSITWTDKLIQSMDSGFFRVLDARRYMELDGITAKHLYRFLAVAFEQTDVVVIDARKLAAEHLGILNPPKYLSRLMQTLEPALDQLIRIQVAGTYQVVSAPEWRIAISRHSSYVPECKSLAGRRQAPPEAVREYCRNSLIRAGFPAKTAAVASAKAGTALEFYTLQRGARVLEELLAEGVSQEAALTALRPLAEPGAEAREVLDGCEIALEVCRGKRPGLLLQLLKDAAARKKAAGGLEDAFRLRFRQQEAAALARQTETGERELTAEYEQYRRQLAATIFFDLPDTQKELLRKVKADRFGSEPLAQGEVDALILQDLAREHAAPFEKWLLRRRVQQTVMPFSG